MAAEIKCIDKYKENTACQDCKAQQENKTGCQHRAFIVIFYLHLVHGPGDKPGAKADNDHDQDEDSHILQLKKFRGFWNFPVRHREQVVINILLLGQ
jgi:hypothetical protein